MVSTHISTHIVKRLKESTGEKPDYRPTEYLMYIPAIQVENRNIKKSILGFAVGQGGKYRIQFYTTAIEQVASMEAIINSSKKDKFVPLHNGVVEYVGVSELRADHVARLVAQLNIFEAAHDVTANALEDMIKPEFLLK